MSAIDPRADLERLVSELKATRTGDGYSARCPAHDDKRNSLSFGIRNDRLYWHCHAGCAQDAVYDAFVASRILERPQKKAVGNGHALKSHQGGNNVAKFTPPISIHDYLDLNGQIVYQTLKFPGKQFRQRRPASDGTWTWNLNGITTILYNLASVVAAEVVYVAEGEKDANNLIKLGLVATTNPMGAGKWRDHYSETLVGKHVVVLPDNDDVGRKHAVKVASSVLVAGCRSVRVVELPGLPDHGDVSDWIEKGNGREELEAMVRRAAPWSRDGTGDPAWRARLIKGDRGPVGNEVNVEIALRYAPELAGRLRFDVFRRQLQARDLPWDASAEWRDWQETDDTRLAMHVQREEINVIPHRAATAAESVARLSPHHPVREYLASLKWDGTPRVRDLLIRYAICRGVSDEMIKFLKAIGLRFMVSAIARIMEPGCKVDTVLVIEGKQGIGKSSFVRYLFGQAWFTDQIADFTSKDYAIDMLGKWVVELSELSVVSKADERVVKAIVSRQTDHYRPPYGRRSIDVEREMVFFATTNRDDYLGDVTGNRRYWPAWADRIDLEAVIRDRDQLWAEALHLYREGYKWFLNEEEDDIARSEQDKRIEQDPWDMPVDSFLNGLKMEYTTTYDLLIACGVLRENMDKNKQMRAANHLRKRGWTRGDKRIDHVVVKVYYKPLRTKS